MNKERDETMKSYRATSLVDLLKMRLHGSCVRPVADQVIFEKVGAVQKEQLPYMDLYLVVGFVDENIDAFGAHLDRLDFEPTEAGVILEKLKAAARAAG